jgi:hypothetical protein
MPGLAVVVDDDDDDVVVDVMVAVVVMEEGMQNDGCDCQLNESWRRSRGEARIDSWQDLFAPAFGHAVTRSVTIAENFKKVRQRVFRNATT